MQDVRGEVRQPKNIKYSLTWRSLDGTSCSVEARGLDISGSGAGVECTREVPLDTVVQLHASDGSVDGECFVAHCTRHGQRYHVGLEFNHKARKTQASCKTDPADTDYYDVLQINPHADMETIHRVFRIMAGRFHPDNPETGDQEEFLRLKRAYDVLSNPDLRAEYDTMRESKDQGTMPIFELKDFVTGVQAEANRRLGVLALLYNQRRMDPEHPAVSLLELEKRMGFPREYLSFAMWYLRAKQFVQAADNADYALTAAGVDHVESNAEQSEIVAKLLRPGCGQAQPHSTPRATTPRNETINLPGPSRYLPAASSRPTRQ